MALKGNKACLSSSTEIRHPGHFYCSLKALENKEEGAEKLLEQEGRKSEGTLASSSEASMALAGFVLLSHSLCLTKNR